MRLEEINQKILMKEGRSKRYRDRIKQYNQNQTFQNNERKIYQQVGEEWTRTYKQPRVKEAKQFLSKIWEQKKHNRIAEWVNNIEKELQELTEGPLESLRATPKKVPNWKIPGHDSIHKFCLKKFTFIHDRLAFELCKCLEETNILEWMTKAKIILIQKDPAEGTIPSMCLPMMWKILTAQIKEISHSLVSRVVFGRTRRMSGRSKRNRWYTVDWSAHPEREQSIVEKWIHGVDWIQEGQWFGLAKLDNRVSEMNKMFDKVINYVREAMKNWKVVLTAGGKSLA